MFIYIYNVYNIYFYVVKDDKMGSPFSNTSYKYYSHKILQKNERCRNVLYVTQDFILIKVNMNSL